MPASHSNLSSHTGPPLACPHTHSTAAPTTQTSALCHDPAGDKYVGGGVQERRQGGEAAGKRMQGTAARRPSTTRKGSVQQPAILSDATQLQPEMCTPDASRRQADLTHSRPDKCRHATTPQQSRQRSRSTRRTHRRTCRGNTRPYHTRTAPSKRDRESTQASHANAGDSAQERK